MNQLVGMTNTSEIPEGYERIDKIIDLGKANIYGFLILVPVSIMYIVPYYLVWRKIPGLYSVFSDDGLSPFMKFAYTIVVVVAGIVLHELIHGLTWSFFTKRGFRSIRFGIMLRMLTPYCHCKELLTKNQYILGAIMPAIVLGLIPGIWAIATGSVAVLYLGVFFTIAAIGDFMIIFSIRNEAKDSLILDHPNEAGCYVFRKKLNPDN